MAKLMNMPKIGVNMTDGTITEWYVNEGDEVKFGEMALAAETDKDVQDIPADQTGTVLKIMAQVGDNVECHKPLAIVGTPGENIDSLLAEISNGGIPTASAEVVAAAPVQSTEVAQAPSTGRVPVSPLAKKMAKDLGIDLSDVKYTGVRVTKSDILAYEKQPEESAAVVSPIAVNPVLPDQGIRKTTPYTGMRKKIGSRLTESVVTKPWAALSVAVDMTKAIEWRKRVNEIADVKVGFNEMVAKACARALQEYPMMNAQLAAEGTDIYEMEEINIGIAVNTDRGLMVPVLKNVATKGVVELAKEFAGLVSRTKEQANIQGDLSGGTFTISNLGARGISSFRAVINPPECGILALAATIKTPVVIDDEIVIRPMMNITLSFDHRIVDGDYAAQFVAYIGNLLEDPMKILM
ncbi:dihydrolipoamide acetyltransferase family protein [Acetobacterium woodii]|uniref:Dihydrolipoamide acetyltransferase component of pyruvate dehydrogenase complex n=1 Tax=Acetobacterium woodii (strain ATCC 29683 / DSM 1030 / JCM 2381 / KCTC 1655 / WB1) TaxID=931626 RepID=H6LDZ4_ACEWD|nr:dihydrolipoamide acetyltransferase family protein [Acetobacterium woodii]AFA48037.1 pyruvate dehydrogenase E2 component, dihydrolipoyllysine-residue acetyltransferase PdhC1 [Acetobacterium woodii DSM 1030]